MRTEGRVSGSYYVLSRGGGIVKRIPLDEARTDSKVLAAIERNGWEKISG